MFQLEPGDRARYADAFADLLLRIDPATAAVISAESRDLKTDQWGVITGAFVRVILQHIIQARPLEFPPKLIADLQAVGAQIETPLFECRRCGYLALRTWQSCILCGGPVGLGAHSISQSVRAGLN